MTIRHLRAPGLLELFAAAVLLAAGSTGTVTTAVAQTSREDGAAASPTVVITGANRGLGLEFAKQLDALGWKVIATARRPDEAKALKTLGVRIEQLDVTDAESVAGLAKRIGDAPVDLLINNAGVGARVPTLDALDPDDAERVLQVNCLGPMRVTKALLPALRRGDKKLIVNISSRLGSIELNTGGGFYGYRESKAALNMFTRSLAGQLRSDGFTCIAMSPGWVRTDMGGPEATLSPEESIGGMLEVIGGLTIEDSGRYLSYDGAAIPW